jgi:thymidylate synthase
MSAGLSLHGQALGELYPQVLSAILEEGAPVAPRGLPTRELMAVTIVIERPSVPLFDDPVRVLNPAFAIAEACWIIAGTDAPWIFDYNARLRDYADDDVLKGAYGPRIRRWQARVDQLQRVCDLLRRDPASRQAVIQLFDPLQDWRGARDVPCTLSYRFFIRDGRLHQHTSMRSQDAWLGMPYDLFSGAVLHTLVAAEVGVELGRCVHSVDSLHLYDPDMNRAAAVVDMARPAGDAPPFEGLVCPLSEVRATVAAVLVNDRRLGSGWRHAANSPSQPQQPVAELDDRAAHRTSASSSRRSSMNRFPRVSRSHNSAARS